MPTMSDYKPLAHQKALVTGANSGIGEGVAIALGQAGADVVVNYVEGDDAAAAVADRIRQFGCNALVHKADVSREDEVDDMFDRAVSELGTIDILVNNAGIQRDSDFADMTVEKWNQVIGVNLTGQFLCSRAAIREFLRRGVVPSVSRGAGKIICMSSVHQAIPWAGHANYATSKGGIKLLMESMAQELAPKRIRVNAIAPGAIQTPINTSAWNTPDALKRLLTLIPYGRIGLPEDIARAAVWLASDDSDYVVGTTLFVDGGMTLYPGFSTNG
jgi:glucose 1-dehydrogenase